jgi:hypothetical protein
MSIVENTSQYARGKLPSHRILSGIDIIPELIRLSKSRENTDIL